MSNSRALVRATVAGTILQLAMVLTGHSMPAVANLFPVIGMGISLVAGIQYAHFAGQSSIGTHAIGGLVAGGLCAFIGIVVSYLLGDVTAMILVLGTCSSAVAGAIGGVIGHFVFAKSPSSASA